MRGLPEIALSVRQPWAWAIFNGKDVENRSLAAIRHGMIRRRIAIHAAKGMTRDEYEDAAEMMAKIGVKCPMPDELIRGAIIGAATVTDIVKESESPWFFGPRGLVLADAVSVAPIPAVGALGYFRWQPSRVKTAPVLPWMVAWPYTTTKQPPAQTPNKGPDLFA